MTLAVSNNGGAATAPVGSYTITPSAATGGTFTASNYTITYATGTLTVNPAAASQLVIVTQPSATATAGTPFASQPVIDEEDQYGNLEIDDNSTVITVTASSGSAQLMGATATVKAGVATFTKLADDAAETIALSFSGAGLTAGPSNSLTVTPGPASELVIHTQPSTTATAGVPFGTQPVFYEEDQYGNLETGDSSTVVTVSLASGTGPLQGTTTATVTDGIATFANLADDTAESISLKFNDGGLAAGPSTSIVVSPGAASKLVIQTQPSATATAGQPFATQPVIDEEDQYGNLETGDNSTVITAASSSGSAQLVGAGVTVSGGVASFTKLADDTAGTIVLDFTGGGVASGPSSSLTVTPAAASELVVHTQPSATATAGVPFATQPIVYEEDQYGNLETGDNSTVVTAFPSSGAGPAHRRRCDPD